MPDNINDNANATIGHLARSNLAAQLSEQMAIATIPILAVVALGVSAEESATPQAINTLPFLLLSIPAGLLADRTRRKRLMIATELIRAAALFLLFALFSTRILGLYALGRPWGLRSLRARWSTAWPRLRWWPPWSARTICQAPTAGWKLPAALRLPQGLRPVACWPGGHPACSLFWPRLSCPWQASGICRKLPAEAPHAAAKRHILRELSEGIAFIARNHYLRPIVATAFVFNTAWYLLLGVFAYYAIHHLNFGASAVGVALGVYGFGMVAGAFLYTRMARALGFGQQILLGPVCAATAALLLLATRVAPPSTFGIVVFAAFFLFGFGPIVWTISTTSLRQIVTPGGLIARVSSVIMTVTFGARPLGAALGVWLSATFGVTSCLTGVAIGFALQLGIIALSEPARLATIGALEPGAPPVAA